MHNFETHIQESIVDIANNTLDPDVFNFPEDGSPPNLKETIRRQIMEDVGVFTQIMGVGRFYIVGSILSKSYSDNADIDVNIEGFDNEVDDLLYGKLLEILGGMNGKLATGTTHPINYYIMLDDVDETRFDAMFDVANNSWIKEPTDIEFNVNQYIKNFHKVVSTIDLTIAKIRRDVIDYDALSEFDDTQIDNIKDLMQRKLIEITDKIETLSDIKTAIVRKRKRSFKKPLTPDELAKYKSKNLLPDNVIYKMLERYYYWAFIKKLEKLIADKDILEPKDIKKLKNVDKEACLKTFEKYLQSGESPILNEKIKTIKARKIDWKDPASRRKSHMHKMNRGTGRKSLQQVPTSQMADPSMVASSNIGSAKKIIEVAKKAPSGIWRITPSQVKWLAAKFHHIPPDVKNNMKHLGNTGIIVWRKDRGVYYLVKRSSHIMKRHH
jgi:hypothetical protein